MEIIIRRAELSDSKALAELCCEALGYDCTEEMMKANLNRLCNDREAVFVAECDGKAAGFVHAEKYQVLYSQLLVNILGLAVSSGLRRKGIGRMLMDAAEDYARETGAAGIRLNSGGSRKEAHDFYRSIGFDNEKIQVRFLKMI